MSNVTSPPSEAQIDLLKRATAGLLNDIRAFETYSSKGIGVIGEQKVYHHTDFFPYYLTDSHQVAFTYKETSDPR